MTRWNRRGLLLYLLLLWVFASGCGGGSASVTASSGSPPPPPPPPPGPQSHSVSISWQPSSSTGIVSYNVYRAIRSGGPYTRIASVTATSFNDTGVQAGTTYFYV